MLKRQFCANARHCNVLGYPCGELQDGTVTMGTFLQTIPGGPCQRGWLVEGREEKPENQACLPQFTPIRSSPLAELQGSRCRVSVWVPAVLGTEMQSLLERLSLLSQASSKPLFYAKTLPGSLPFFPAWQGDATSSGQGGGGVGSAAAGG